MLSIPAGWENPGLRFFVLFVLPGAVLYISRYVYSYFCAYIHFVGFSKNVLNFCCFPLDMQEIAVYISCIIMQKEVSPMNKADIRKVVLAYSGGLDTSIIIPWLK